LATEAELRLTGLMTSPSPEVAQTKLGKYLQEEWRLRNANQLAEALVIVLVSGEYYWRQHFPIRAAGLLLEAADLFHLIEQKESSQRCLTAALNLILEGGPKTWWEYEIMANTFLLTACLAIIENPSLISKSIGNLRNLVPQRLQTRLQREDGYRVAINLRRTFRMRNLTLLEELDEKPTLRSSSDYTTLYEYLMGLSERYALIRDGITALRRITQLED
jgi:hypothetical protein